MEKSMPGSLRDVFSHGFATDRHELRLALIDRCVELATYAIGAPPNKARSSRRECRWGRNGSFALALRKEKRGFWYDHEVGEGGDVFDLIQLNIIGRPDFRAAVEWARRWLGWSAEGPAPILTDADERRRQIAEQQARQDEEEAQERRRRLAKANAIWDRSIPIDGTIAEA
jgi:hypothetical protein